MQVNITLNNEKSYQNNVKLPSIWVQPLLQIEGIGDKN